MLISATPARDERVGDEVHAVEALGDREGPVGVGDRRREVDLAEHLEAGELAEQRGQPRIVAEVGELGRRRLDQRERGVEAVPPEHGVAEEPRDPRRAAPVAGRAQEVDRLGQQPLRLLVGARGRCREAGPLQQGGPLDRLRASPRARPGRSRDACSWAPSVTARSPAARSAIRAWPASASASGPSAALR